MKRLIAPLFVLAVTGLGSACTTSPESTPVAPSAVAIESSESADAQRGVTDRRNPADRPELVVLRGTIRDLNARHTQFTLVLPLADGQTEPRSVVVRLDDRTDIVAGGHLVRRNVLQNGLECGVEGIQRVDHVLARKITLARRPDRQ